MQSEFYNVALNQIRYSLVWEDSGSLYKGLQIKPHDQVLVITSAGCNVLNTLLANPQQVTAIDLNPIQNKLFAFKQYLILHHEYTHFRALLGLDGAAAVQETWQQLELTVPHPIRDYWSLFFQSHPAGLLTAGKLETYLHQFYQKLAPALQTSLRQLIKFDNIPDQRAYFEQELHRSSFPEQFITYFDEANLSKGRAPELFKYATESGGEAFYNRLKRQVATTLVRDNFFFRFFFFGPENIPPALLPPCYQAHNFAALRRQLPKLTVVTAEAVDYLLSPAGRDINKASLSNIFEYTSSREFARVNQALFADPERPLRYIYWNLLQEQGDTADSASWTNTILPDYLTQAQGCFYFRDVRVQEAVPAKSRFNKPTINIPS